MTRYLAPIGALFLAAILTAQAQSADERYIWIYTLIQEADTLNEKGAKIEAANKYREAQASLKELQKLYPDWNPKVVNYRIIYIGDKLGPLAPQVVSESSTNPAAKLVASASTDRSVNTNPNVAPAPGPDQWKAVQDELAQLNNQNALLQAKLKEAMSVQPSGSDPRELAKAEEQVRALQKERDLLQVRLQEEQAKAAKIPDPAVLEQERQLVAELQTKLARQTELAAALQQENTTLKLRIGDLKYPAVLPSNKASEQLEIAKTTISALQATNIALRTERIVLEARLSELSKSFVSKSAVEKLEQERDDLRKQLTAAQKASSVSSGGMTADELERQLKIAHARLEAFEAKAIPYTPEEQALFKQPDKKIEVASVKPAKKQELPAGAGPLIFEAQRALDNGRLDEAEKKYQEVLRQDEKNTYTLVRLAAVQIEQNHIDDAEKNINKALSIDPEDPLCLYLKGYLCVQQNKYDQAFDALSLSAKLLPDEARTQYLLGKVLLQKGAPAQAETALRKAIQLIPNYREAHYSLALIYSRQKPPLKELAQWHYRKATTLGYPADPALEKQLEEAPAVSSAK